MSAAPGSDADLAGRAGRTMKLHIFKKGRIRRPFFFLRIRGCDVFISVRISFPAALRTFGSKP